MAGFKNGSAAPRVGRGSGAENLQTLAGRSSEHSANVIDFQTRQGVDAYRLRWVRRRIPVGQELATYLADMAFHSKGFRHD